MDSQQRDLHAPPRALRFSTQGIAPLSRVQLWESHNAKALISLDIRTLDESPLHASEVNLQFPSLRLAQVQGTAQIVERSESFIRENPTDVVAVFFALAGDAFFYHRGGHEFLKPGQAIMYDADLPFMRGFARGLQELVLTIPRSLFRELSGGKAMNQPVRFDFGPGAGSQGQELARMIRQTVASELEPADDVEQSLLELFRLIASGNKEGTAAGYLAAAKGYVERHLGDPALSTPEVAAAVGISERQLGRAFAEADLTLGRYVLELRLDRGRELLASPAGAALSIGEISARLGFSSQNYFSRAFKERFKATPLQIRKATRAGVLLGEPDAEPQSRRFSHGTDAF
jgi:AraC-like DNA-binding protein